MTAPLSLEARIRRLEDVEAVKRRMYTYWRVLDHKLWAELPGCFAEDVIGDYGMPEWRQIGREALVNFLRVNEGGPTYQVSHAGHNAEVDILGSDRARGLFKLHDWVVIGGATVMRGFGQYDVQFTRSRDSWLIQHLKLHYAYREERLVYVDNQRLHVTPALLQQQ